LKYIGEQTGTELETVTGSLAKMIRSMASAEKGTGAQSDAFKSLGVSVVDVNGNLRDSQDVFGDVLNALGGIANETERDALAMAIFGKSAQELNPLIKLGADGMAEMAAEAQGLGAIMSEDAVRGAADLNDRIAALKAGIGGMAGTIGAALAPAITKIIGKFQEWLASPKVQEGLKNLVEGIGRVADTVGEVVSKLMSGDIAGALGEIFPPATVDQIMNVADAIGKFINETLIPFVTQHAEEIKGAVIAIAAVLAGAGIVALIASIANPIGLIVALVGLLGAAWAGNWGGIRDKLMEVWAVVQPVLQRLWEWLKINIPIAIQALSDFWKNTLLPAINAVWAFIRDQIFPLFVTLYDWLEYNIPKAISTVSDFWTNTLLPAINAVWDFIDKYLVPLFTALWTLLDVSLKLALEVLAGIWENVLLPAITKIYDFIKEKLQPILDALKVFFDTTLLPIIKTFISEGLDKLSKAWDGIKEAIGWVIEKVQAFIDIIENIKLPDWLTPGSPTPFEMGLWGISDALQAAVRDTRQLDNALGKMKGPGIGSMGTNMNAANGANAVRPNEGGKKVTIFGGVHVTNVDSGGDLLEGLMAYGS